MIRCDSFTQTIDSGPTLAKRAEFSSSVKPASKFATHTHGSSLALQDQDVGCPKNRWLKKGTEHLSVTGSTSSKSPPTNDLSEDHASQTVLAPTTETVLSDPEDEDVADDDSVVMSVKTGPSQEASEAWTVSKATCTASSRAVWLEEFGFVEDLNRRRFGATFNKNRLMVAGGWKEDDDGKTREPALDMAIIRMKDKETDEGKELCTTPMLRRRHFERCHVYILLIRVPES